MRRKLILKEKQAYEGAKMFYYFFLPILILCYLMVSIFQNSLNVILSIVTIILYGISLNFYIKCNKI